MNALPLEQLQPGRRFEIPAIGKCGRLLSLSVGGAQVEYDQVRVQRFQDRWGEPVQFQRSKERVTISRATAVVALGDPR